MNEIREEMKLKLFLSHLNTLLLVNSFLKLVNYGT